MGQRYGGAFQFRRGAAGRKTTPLDWCRHRPSNRLAPPPLTRGAIATHGAEAPIPAVMAERISAALDRPIGAAIASAPMAGVAVTNAREAPPEMGEFAT
jgi:hypothetical protein